MISAHPPAPNPKLSRIIHHVSRISLPSYLSSPYAALFLFLLSIYLLTYTPRINSSDGLAMFATAESLVRRGALDIEQIRWMDLQQGTYGLDGLLYSRKGVGVPIGLLPLTWLGLVAPWFGTVGVSLLFNAIVTALTAVILSAYLRQLGFHQRTGLIVALTFGLTTLAWPYAKSLFSDPFSGLLLLTAAYALLKMSKGAEEKRSRGEREQGRKEAKTHSPAPLLPCPPAGWQSLAKSLRYPFLAGLFLGWNVATRYAEALFLPVYGLLLLYYLGSKVGERSSRFYRLKFQAPVTNPWPPILAFSTPILLIGLGLITFNVSRYGDPFNTGYLPNETFSGVLWEGIVGQLVSPGRGLLLYCPVLILSLGGVVPFFRRFGAEASVALAIIIIHLLLYGKWFMWHGGYAWGPRFMIPTLPFWAMFLAPVVEILDFRFRISDFQSLKRNASLYPLLLRNAFFVLAVLGLIFQFQSVTIDFAPFQNSLLDTGLPLFARQTFFNPRYSALVEGWAFITPETLDLAWVWPGRVNWWLLATLVANITITGLYFKWQMKNDKKSKIQLLPYLSTLITLIFLLAHTHTLPAKPLQEAVTALNETIRPADAIITNNTEITMPFAELYKGHAPVLGLNNGGFPLPDNVTSRLSETMAGHSQVWWLPNWLPPEESAIEQTLSAEGFRARSDNFDGQRLVLFAYPANLSPYTGFEANFDDLISLTEVVYPANTPAGVAFPVELKWQAMAPLTQNYHVFIHLLDGAGQVVAQADGQPVQWNRPTSTWVVGETVVDRHGLWIPGEIAPGKYQLLMGLYRPEDGQRLYLLNGEDTVRFEVWIE